MDTPAPRPYALYLRKSKGRAGIPRQRTQTADHLTAIGGAVAAEFTDADQTAFRKVGAARPERKGFDAMLAWLGTHPGAGIAAWHADRILRDPEDTEALIRACVSGNHLIETPRGGAYDLSKPTGRKRLRDDATAATYEVDHLVERTLAAKAEKAAEGLWPGGPRPFGWEPVPAPAGDERKYTGLRLRDSEAELVRDAASAILSGVSLNAIARQWNSAGVTGTSGASWEGRRIARMLSRPRYAGIAVYQGAEAGTAAWPAILPADQFRALQSVLRDPSRRHGPGPERKWLGSGFYECGVCHAKIGAHTVTRPRGKGRHAAYICPGHVTRQAQPLDEWIGDLISARLARVGQSEVPRGRDVPDAAALHAQILAQRETLNEMARLRQQEVIDSQQLAAATVTAREEIAALRARLAATAKVSPLSGMPAGPEAIRGWWGALHVSRQRVIAAEQFAWVRVMPTRRGRPAGTPRDEPFFDRAAIKYEWR